MKLEKNITSCLACGFEGGGEPFFIHIKNEGYAQNEAVICPSCGYQPGFTDLDRGYTFKEWRHKWISSGMEWHTKFSTKPINWNPIEQLKKISVTLDKSNNIIQEPDDPDWHWVPSEAERE